jgi:hypothetical protein
MQSAAPFNPASTLAQPIAHLFLVLGIIMMAIVTPFRDSAGTAVPISRMREITFRPIR